MCDLPTPHTYIFWGQGQGVALFPLQIKGRRKVFPEGPAQMSANKRAGHCPAVLWDSHGRKVYLAA